MRNVVLYAGSSQGREEIERQFESLRRSLAPEDIVVGVHGDVATGIAVQRPGLEAALAEMATGQLDVLYATSPDRISRSIEQLAALMHHAETRGVVFLMGPNPRQDR